MRRKKAITALILLFGLYSFASEKEDGDNNLCNNFISVSGTSNVNTFHCENRNFQTEALTLYKNNTPEQANNLTILVPIKDFSCGNKLMYKDLLETLKSKTHPDIIIELKKFPSLDTLPKFLNTEVDITLAGVTREYNINCEFISCGKNSYILKGAQQVLLSYHNIDPPKKLFGTIRVQNEVFINFAFNVILYEQKLTDFEIQHKNKIWNTGHP